MAESKVGMPSKLRIEPSMRSQEFHQLSEGLSSQESDQLEEQDMAESGEEMSSDSPNEPSMGSQGSPPLEEPSMGTNFPMDLWVGFVNDVPLVGTSADMVDGFIALLQGDLKTAEAKGYKDFLEAAGIDELKPGSILQNHEIQAVIGCSPEVSKYIFTLITEPVTAVVNSAIKIVKGHKTYAYLCKILSSFYQALKKRFPGVFSNDKGQTINVFRPALLGLYESTVSLFIQSHVTVDDIAKFLHHIVNSRVGDAFQGYVEDGYHINLTAVQRRNIRTWVVHSEMHIPIDNILFEKMRERIGTKAAEFMHLFRLKKNTDSVERDLFCSVDWMIKERAYLTPWAAEIWLAQKADLTAEFHATEGAVKEMLKQLDPKNPGLLRDFVNDLTKAGATFH